MLKKSYLSGFKPCPTCSFVHKLIFVELLEVKRALRFHLTILEEASSENETLRDAEYVKNYVGISISTLYRCERMGQIKVAKKEKKKRWYLNCEVERFYNRYHGPRP